MRSFIRWFAVYKHAAPIVQRCLDRAQQRRVLDLCSGGGGPWPDLSAELDVSVTLSDLFPNLGAFEREHAAGGGRVDFAADSVDATAVPPALTGGIRTVFSAMHHFEPALVRGILSDAQSAGEPIAVFEGTRRSLPALFFYSFTPLAVLVMTPFIRPFSWTRLFFTYVVPIVPLVAWWDGIVSCLRTYSEKELHALTADLDRDGWTWEVGSMPGAPLIPATYLVGYPS